MDARFNNNLCPVVFRLQGAREKETRLVDLMIIAAIVAPVSGAATVATIALVRFARRFGKMEQSIENTDTSMKLMAKEHGKDQEHYRENSKEINSQLKGIRERLVSIETLLQSNMGSE